MKRTLKKREEKERERERVEKGARRKKNGWKESEVAGRILGEIILGSARAIWSRANANSEHNTEQPTKQPAETFRNWPRLHRNSTSLRRSPGGKCENHRTYLKGASTRSC